ncbi:MAG: tetratricopeptide repeat protein [Spirochaetaceae bacterium]
MNPPVTAQASETTETTTTGVERPGRGTLRSVPGILVLLVLVLSALSAAIVSGQTRADEAERDADWYAARALEAIEAENYSRAVSLLKEGQEHYPETLRLYSMLGDLYFDEDLYRLALSEYREAERIDPTDFAVLHGAALSLGRLNENEEAVRYLERVLELYPDSPEVTADLGWMYFKTHQLRKGEELLLDAIERYGNERSLTMTLGTIYADMYRYEESREYYERSIESALEDGQDYFAAVAYYNLSLLQKAFYRFNGAMESTDRSLEHARRGTGHLAKGELYEMQMEFRRAHEQYMKAYNLDEETPLAKLDLAALYRTFGRLDEALAYARSVYESEDLHWMFNFGIDERRHRMELHDLLGAIYRGKARVSARTPAGSPTEWLANTVARVQYAVRAWYHEMSFRRIAVDVGQSYQQAGSELDAHWTYFRAHERYRRVAYAHLERARELEIDVIPETEPLYRMHAGELTRDPEAISRAVEAMHPRWERSSIARGLREAALAFREQGRHREADAAAVELYGINPGGLRQHGVDLPVMISTSAVDDAGERRLRRRLADAGFRPVGNGGETPYTLEIEAYENGRIGYRLLREGRPVRADGLDVGLDGDGGAAAVARGVAAAVFRVE